MKPLRTVLRLNAASCIGFGLLFVFQAGPVSRYLGAMPTGLLQGIGVLLMLNGLHLVAGSWRTAIRSREVMYFSGGDIAWFIASIALVGANLLITNPAGQLATVLVALGVLWLGLVQLWMLAEVLGSGIPGSGGQCQTSDADLLPPGLHRAQAIGASWLAMKTWVKVWLLALNGLFLASILFLPEPAARITLAAYVASGPLLAAMMIWQRGLTRLLGLAHLVPWLPLVVYLALRLVSDLAGPRLAAATSPEMFAYVLVLLIAVTSCLLLDVFDCWRWFKGENFRLGAPEAVAAGSSTGTQRK